MTHTEFYEFLKIEPTASSSEIKKAYWKMCKIYHPDKTQDTQAHEKFQRLSFIYSVLSDASKRQHYDRFGDKDLDDVDSGSGSEAEEVDDENEEIDDAQSREAFRSLFEKYGKNKEQMEQIINEHEYEPSAGPWVEKNVIKEWKLVEKKKITRINWPKKYLSGLPASIFESAFIKKIVLLNLDTSQLQELPVEMKNMVALTDLDLSSNKFSEFPEVLLELSELKTLKMERNQLVEVPKLSQLQKLVTVSFFGNQITTIADDAFEGMDHLKHVDLDLNFLSQVPESLTHLQSTVENFELKIELFDAPPPSKRRKPNTKESTRAKRAPPKKRGQPAAKTGGRSRVKKS